MLLPGLPGLKFGFITNLEAAAVALLAAMGWSPPSWAVPLRGAGGDLSLRGRGRKLFCLETGLSWSQTGKREQKRRQDGE